MISFLKNTKIILALAFVSALFWFLAFSGTQASSSDNLSGWAWVDSETVMPADPPGANLDIGWLSFNCTNSGSCGASNYGVRVDPACTGSVCGISGNAWSENLGWLSFQAGDASHPNPTFDRATGVVDGWARFLAQDGNGWDGWVHLKGPTYGVTVSGCNWDGYAWGSDVVGWIHFRGPGYGVVGTGNACTSITSNSAPMVDAGPDQNIVFPASATLNGIITDDGLPNPPGTVTALWAKVSGPGTVMFGNVSNAVTTASFAATGVYILRLTGSDSILNNSDNVTITTTSSSPMTVSCVASPSPALLGQTVTWTANFSGGTAPFTCSWSGTNIPATPAVSCTSPSSYLKSYSTIGLKTARVRVTDADSLTAECIPAKVRINFDPDLEEF
ncbi:MAG: hypothetical protein Q7S12_00805 [bacterium]|nr:hypothetical protein [bacterium]